MPIQNVVFDLGNVFVRWAPLETMKACFPGQDADRLWRDIRPAWRDLNRGKMTFEEGLALFHARTGLPQEGFRQFCDQMMGRASFMDETEALQAGLARAGVPLYCLSDNIKEIVAYYEKHCPFMKRFKGAIISADVGFLKPEPQIYHCLFERYALDPATCVFFDDVSINVEGAKQAGMTSFIFTDAATCARDLKTLGILAGGAF